MSGPVGVSGESEARQSWFGIVDLPQTKILDLPRPCYSNRGEKCKVLLCYYIASVIKWLRRDYATVETEEVEEE